MSKKNVVITTGFALVTTTQLALGICLLAVVAKGGGKVLLLCQENRPDSERLPADFYHVCAAQVPPPIPFQAFRMCGFVRHRNLEVAYTAISLFYGE